MAQIRLAQARKGQLPPSQTLPGSLRSIGATIRQRFHPQACGIFRPDFNRSIEDLDREQ